MSDATFAGPDPTVCARLDHLGLEANEQRLECNRAIPRHRMIEPDRYFDWHGSSDAPTDAIGGRLEPLRGSALFHRKLTNCIARSLFATGGF